MYPCNFVFECIHASVCVHVYVRVCVYVCVLTHPRWTVAITSLLDMFMTIFVTVNGPLNQTMQTVAVRGGSIMPLMIRSCHKRSSIFLLLHAINLMVVDCMYQSYYLLTDYALTVLSRLFLQYKFIVH